MDKYYTTFDVARICQVSPGSVSRWIREGKLPAAVTAGGHHRVRTSHLVELLQKLRMPIPAGLSEVDKQTTILIVDDETNVRALLRSILEQNYPDFQVEEAEEGFLAGWKAHGLKPDLVLLDIMLPGINGFRVCQFIRDNEELQNTKIIVITALQDPQIREQAIKAGADDFLAKPFEVSTLKNKIESQLGLTEGEVRAA